MGENMNEEILELLQKYPELIEKFEHDYRLELFILHCKNNPPNIYQFKYAQVAEIYKRSEAFKIASISKATQEILNIKKDNATLLAEYAKQKGLLPRRKTTHSKGYLQKNYIPKSEGIKK